MTSRTERHCSPAGPASAPARRLTHKVSTVSPRRSRRVRPAVPLPLGPERAESWPDGDWVVRQIPGAAPDVDRFEEKDFRALGYLEAEVVLASDDALAAFKQAIVEASKPPAPAATS